jgi:hypothetical protein
MILNKKIMINETIKEIYIKGDDDHYPSDYPIIQTDNHFYRIDLGGFEFLENINLTEYHKYEEGNLLGLKIIDFFSHGSGSAIFLSDDQSVDLDLGDSGLEFRFEDKEDYKELRTWLESPKAHEVGWQQLTKEQPRWQKT